MEKGERGRKEGEERGGERRERKERGGGKRGRRNEIERVWGMFIILSHQT